MKIIYLLFLASFLGSIGCKPPTVIYLVRHAEKADTSRDPDLNAIGKIRAEKLATLLKNENIASIYSTNYKRTIQTATPLSEMIQVPLQFYPPDNLIALAKNIRDMNKNTLVVGHSNTIVTLLKAFGFQFSKKTIEDSDYSNLFKLTQRSPTSKIKFKELTF